MKLNILILLCLFGVFKFSECDWNRTIFQNLFTNLTSGSYNKNIRPSSFVSIEIHLALKQVISIDEKNQVLNALVYVTQMWYDPRLVWNPSDYDDLDEIRIPAKSIWIPDTILINTADTDAFLKVSDSSIVAIDSDSEIHLELAVLVRSRCHLNVKAFPADSHKCNLIFGSWSLTSNEINYDTLGSVLELKDFSQNPVWQLSNNTYIYSGIYDTDVAHNLSYGSVVFELHFSRKPLFYVINSIFPCIILNVVTFVAFSFPYAQQLTISLTIFLSYAVYALRISSDLPVQSEFIPFITIYYIASIFLTFVSMLWFCLLNRMQTKNHIPFLLKKLAILITNIRRTKKSFKIKNSEINEIKKMDQANSENQNVENEINAPISNKNISSEKNNNQFQNEMVKTVNISSKDEFEMHILTLNISFLLMSIIIFLVSLLASWFSSES